MSAQTTSPEPNPTWYSTIRHMFTTTDIDHMSKLGLDLTSYDQVQASAGPIYGQVSTQNMPPGQPWTPDMVGLHRQVDEDRRIAHELGRKASTDEALVDRFNLRLQLATGDRLV